MEMEEVRALAAALIPLTSRSISQAARDAELSKPNLSAALRGARTVGRDAWGRLIGVLGAPGGSLAPGVVHRWEVRDQNGLAALSLALASVGPGWVLIPVAFAGGITLPPVPLYALRRGEVRALVKYRPQFGVVAADAFPTPDRLQGLAAYPPGVDQVSPRRLDDAVGRGWWDGGEVSVEMFDGLFGSSGQGDQDVTWEDVQRMAQAMGFGPGHVATILRQCGAETGGNSTE